MQILIDIPEKMYLNAKTDTLCGADILVNAIKNGTPFYKNATNFEVSKLLFPNTKIIKHCLGDGAIYVDMDLADAPYKADKE